MFDKNYIRGAVTVEPVGNGSGGTDMLAFGCINCLKCSVEEYLGLSINISQLSTLECNGRGSGDHIIVCATGDS